MTPRWRQRAFPLALAVGCYGLALGQRPGVETSDTKIDLHVDPGGFLADVASVWTSSGALGHVQGGQYGGYLWPMGPFFALGHLLGGAPWLVHRLWLGTLLALAAYGTVRLLDALLGRPRGVTHVVAAAIVVLNPYVVVFSNRTSVVLLAYAALPWLLLAVHRGVREPRGWLWPAVFALVLTTSGGGVNAAVTAWVLVGPLLLLVYEPLIAGVEGRGARAFAWRSGVTSAAASAWWVGPVLVQALYGIDFLAFTEQPGTIWGTTSVTESLRLMGYWTSYIGVGYSGELIPYFDDADTMLFAAPVLAATLVVPGLALAGFAWTRRWRYGPFFMALTLLGLAIMVAGFPDGTLLRRGLTFGYYRLEALQFLRTTYKAGPLVALGIACLGGAAAGELWRQAAERRRLAVALAIAAAALLAASAWPLASGRAIDSQLTWERIPAAWVKAGSDLDREMPPNRRAIVLPGQLFAFYEWGGTVDPILPVVSERPVAVRGIVPYSDLHTTDLLWTVDALVQQRRLLPGQLEPLLELMGVGAVVAASDDDRARGGALQAGEAARVLAGQPGLRRPARSYGPVRPFGPEPGKPGRSVALAQVRRYDVRSPSGIVRVAPTRPQTVVDGSASTLAGLAAFGALPRGGPLAYAADRSAGELRRAAGEGAEIVIGDGNRRRVLVASRLSQNVGWTVGARDELPIDAAVLDPFEGRGSDSQTVAVLDGARYARAPFSPGFSQFPEHRPFAAFDGDPRTTWLADRSLERARHWAEIGFERRRDVPWVDLVPYSDSRGVVDEVEIAGRRFAVHPGVNRLRVGLRGVDRLRVRIASVRQPTGVKGGAGGIAQVTLPGLPVREALRPPVLAERALMRRDLRRTALTYLFERTTGDDPFRRGVVVGPAQANQVRDAQDGEIAIARRISPPAARTYSAAAWATAAPDASDATLDRLAGYRGSLIFSGSGRWLGRPGFRASGAFDGDPRRGWVAGFIPGRPAWIEWTASRDTTVSELRLAPPPVAVATPSRVRVRVSPGAAASPPVSVAADGRVRLARPLRGRTFRLEVLAARQPARASFGVRARRAVGIGELTGPRVPRVAIPTSGRVNAPCGVARLASTSAQTGGQSRSGLRIEATVAELDAGLPLRARGCGALGLPAGSQTLRVAPGPFRVDLLRLRSPAPAGLPAPSGGGRLLSSGAEGRGERTGVRVALSGPSWLILGESYNRAWRATCDGRSLGKPVVVDGFANGWRVPADCRAVDFAFAPNRLAKLGYLVSLLACAVLIGVMLLRWRRDRKGALAVGRSARAARPAEPSAEAASPAEAPASAAPVTGPLTAATPAALAVRWPLLPDADPPVRWPLRRAVVAGLAAGVVLGIAFALRAGMLIAPAVALVLWRGVSARVLILAAGGLLVAAVPAAYLLAPGDQRGGYEFQYAVDRIDAHWIGLAAVVMLGFALARTLSAARAARRS